MEKDKLKLKKLEDGEEQYYHLLGIGCGIGFAHCFFLGAKHNENFCKRVIAYKIIPNEREAYFLEKVTGNSYISVQFFELKINI